MTKIALIGCALTCLVAPANAVVVVQKTAVSAHVTALLIARSPAPAIVQPSPPLGREQMAIAVPGLIIGIIMFRLGKPRSPRPVNA